MTVLPFEPSIFELTTFDVKVAKDILSVSNDILIWSMGNVVLFSFILPKRIYCLFNSVGDFVLIQSEYGFPLNYVWKVTTFVPSKKTILETSTPVSSYSTSFNKTGT